MSWLDIKAVAFTVGEYPLSYIELAGTLFGLVSVFLAARASIWNWPAGIVNEIALFILFFQVRLYADMLLQVFFFVTTIYGWWRWGRSGENEVRIGRLSGKSRIGMVALIVAGSGLIGWIVSNLHHWLPRLFPEPAAFPFADSFVMTSSMVATVLLARKRIENWWCWLAGDVVCVVLYRMKGIQFLSAEYLIFLGLAAAGLWRWSKLMSRD